MASQEWKLVELRRVTGQIEVVTGLRIGASQETMEIQGNDNPILRNPANDEPYVPGSSLKGKMRSMTEWWRGKLSADGKPYENPDDPRCPVTRVFGASAQKDAQNGPTRLVVRDAFLAEASRKRLLEGRPVTEIKHENTLNRLTAMANPRPMERVIPGVQFEMALLYRVLDTGDGGELDRRYFDEVVLTALALVEADCLGGGGSRGNGQVRFRNLAGPEGASLALPSLNFNQARTA